MSNPQPAADPRPDVPLRVRVSGDSGLPGRFYLSCVASRSLLVLDGAGAPIWSYYEPRSGGAGGFWDFKKHVCADGVFYSYHDVTGTYDDYGMMGYGPGQRVLLDESFRELRRITFSASATVPAGAPLDGHDFLLLGRDHYIAAGYLHETVYNHPEHPEGSQVVYAYLQEVRDGAVVWDWRSIDHPELYAMTAPLEGDSSVTAADYGNAQTTVPDCIHFNSVTEGADGSLICSFRNIDAVLCLDRRDGHIRWCLSGKGDQFGLREEQKSSKQHYATVQGSAVHVFDNGNVRRASRLLTYHIDPEQKRLLQFSAVEPAGKYSAACGSVQFLPSGLLVVGWGAAVDSDECMTVLDPAAGNARMRVFLETPGNITYRAVYAE